MCVRLTFFFLQTDQRNKLLFLIFFINIDLKLFCTLLLFGAFSKKRLGKLALSPLSLSYAQLANL